MTFVDIGKKVQARDHTADIEKIRQRDGVREEARGKKDISFPQPQFTRRAPSLRGMQEEFARQSGPKPPENAETLIPVALDGINYLASRPIEITKQKLLLEEVKKNEDLQKVLKDALTEWCPSVPCGNWGKAAVLYGHTYYRVKTGQIKYPTKTESPQKKNQRFVLPRSHGALLKATAKMNQNTLLLEPTSQCGNALHSCSHLFYRPFFSPCVRTPSPVD